MNKRKSHAFGKDCYLLGKDKHSELIWLEAASWDCSWYWGFGYIKVYTNSLNPNHSHDISSHTHWSSLLHNNTPHTSHVNEVLKDSTLTDEESWELSDLMQSFYSLKSAAEILRQGGSHLSSNGNKSFLIDTAMVETINKVMLPALFKEVYRILT